MTKGPCGTDQGAEDGDPAHGFKVGTDFFTGKLLFIYQVNRFPIQKESPRKHNLIFLIIQLDILKYDLFVQGSFDLFLHLSRPHLPTRTRAGTASR